jgi:EpsI family protein
MTNQLRNWLRFLLAALLLAIAAVFVEAHSRAEREVPREELVHFPAQVGDWVGVNLGMDPSVREILGDGDFLTRLYQRSGDTAYIDLFLAYFPTQRAGNTVHSPEHCLPGAGWLPVEHTLIQLSRPAGPPLTVNRYVIAKGLDRDLVLYWYQSHGRVIASEYWAKFYLVADSMRMNRSDCALVRVVTPLAPGESIDAGQQRVVEFTELMLPTLDKYVPL